MAPTEYGYDIDEAAARLERPGYHKMETGWTVLDSGAVVVNCLTDMPGVTGEMWDWWFAWHSCESARYKLWHPDAHQYSAVGQRRYERPELTQPAVLPGQRVLCRRVRGRLDDPAGHPVPRPGPRRDSPRAGRAAPRSSAGWARASRRSRSAGSCTRCGPPRAGRRCAAGSS